MWHKTLLLDKTLSYLQVKFILSDTITSIKALYSVIKNYFQITINVMWLSPLREFKELRAEGLGVTYLPKNSRGEHTLKSNKCFQ
jgi:hypothetical protein